MKSTVRACRTADRVDDIGVRFRLLHRWRWLGPAIGVLLIGSSLGVLQFGHGMPALGDFVRLLSAPRGEEVRGHGSFADTASNQNDAACMVRDEFHVSGKNGGWRPMTEHWVTAGSPRLVLSDGRELELPEAGVSVVPFTRRLADSSNPTISQAGHFAIAQRFRWRDVVSEDRRLVAECLVPGESYYFDGCMSPPTRDGELPQLRSCTSGDRAAFGLTLTPGSRGARFATLSEPLAYPLLVVLVFAAALLYIVHEVRRRAGSVTSFAHTREWGASRPQGSERSPLPWIGPLVVAPFALLVWGTRVPISVLWCAIGLAVMSYGLHRVHRSRRELLGWAKQVETHPTVPLAQADGEEVELDVRVDRQCPTTTAALSREAGVAHVSVQIWQRIEIQGRRHHSIRYELCLDRILFGPELAIHDPSGQGVLELGGARWDFRANQVLLPWSQLTAFAHGLARSSLATQPNQSEVVARQLQETLLGLTAGDYLVRESVVSAGESLYVLGPVQRELGSHDQQLHYRAPPTRAKVSRQESSAAAPVFVHAGTEGSLLGELTSAARSELRWMAVIAAVVVVVGGGLVALTATCLLP